MDTVKLRNGVEMPILGYGVYQVSPSECERCVRDAISAGYRLIDTAQAYGNEQNVGNAIRNCGVPREELFIVTKVWISNAGYERAKASIGQDAGTSGHRLHRPAAHSSAVQRLLRHMACNRGSVQDWQVACYRCIKLLSRPFH